MLNIEYMQSINIYFRKAKGLKEASEKHQSSNISNIHLCSDMHSNIYKYNGYYIM